MAVARTAPTVSITVRPGNRYREPFTGAVPLRTGVPWPRAALRELGALRLENDAGESVTHQASALLHWPDGSVRWLLLDWMSEPCAAGDEAVYRLCTAPAAVAARDTLARQSDGTVDVDTGAIRARLASGPGFPLQSVSVRGEEVLDHAALVLEPAALGSVSFEPPLVVEDGAVRCRVVTDGRAGPLHVRAEFDFHAGSDLVRVDLRVRNERAAAHRRGWWPLGARGAVYLDGLSLVLTPIRRAVAQLRASPFGEDLHGACTDLYQESSGGEFWNCHNHVDASGRVPMRIRGYKVDVDGTLLTGLRASPSACVGDGDRHVAVAVPAFWENFPKSLAASVTDGLRVGLFPHQFPAAHEIQGGEQKSHEFWVRFDAAGAGDLAWCHDPPVACLDVDWSVASGAIPYLCARGPADDSYEVLVDQAIDPDVGFAAKREHIDEYGWRNFGDLYADHEARFHRGQAPFVSHYNNQYDGIGGCAVQFLRSADPRWHRLMGEQARHVADIDVYHTLEDRWAFNRGLFWHTNHYVEAGIATHRTFTPGRGNAGGGPAPEHLYSGGLLLHFLLTGCALSRDTVVDFGEYVIDADDGRKRIFGVLARGHTGYVSASGSDDYHGPGRGSGNSIAVLMDAFVLTGRRRYLDKAEQLIRRCIHPHDDVQARELGNIEARWFYMVFLHALTRYLDLKEALGEVDERYAYGRAALLHYVRWAAEHEYPYLERPEKLDFPTETWAAQEMRKSEVFDRAGRYTDEAERRRFAERAAYFHQVAVSQLSAFKERSHARPCVLILNYGIVRETFHRGQVAPAAPAPAPVDFGEPERFEPQKRRFMRRARLLAVALAALTAGALAYAVA